MNAEFLHGFLSACRHQFSWPRRNDNGDYYQICVHCGTMYGYDWSSMRRLAPVENDCGAHEAGRPSMRKCGAKRAWIPRERRLRHRVSVLFRIPGTDNWMGGVTENISRSGLLFLSAISVEMGASVELMFEMPQELAGEASAQVICKGTIVRVAPGSISRKRRPFVMACTIESCEFVSPPRTEAAAG